MSLNTAEATRRRAAADASDALGRGQPDRGEAFSTALFTGLNIAVFLILAACVVAAAIVYGLGA